MKMHWLAVVCLVGIFGSSALADLAGDVETILKEKILHKAVVGIEVYQLGSSPTDAREVLSLRATTPFTPASNLKLTTTSAALDRFGPGFRFKTMLFLHGDDLVLVGDGDPTFGDAEFLKRAGWTTTTVFASWAAQLRTLNVSAVRDVIIDDSVFDEQFTQPLWPAGQHTARFEAEVGGFNLNANCVDFVVQPSSPGKLVSYTMDPPTLYVTVRNTCVTGQGNKIRLDRKPDSNIVTMAGETPSRGNAMVAITIHDPPLFGANVLAETLTSNGVKVTGAIKRDRTTRQHRQGPEAASWRVIGIHETPLPAVLARCNKDSMNVYAESLCKRLGFEASQTTGTWENGTAAVGAFLKKAGVPEAEFHLEDGSGLSRANTISPHGLALTLIHDFYCKDHETFKASLSVAGVDGTLDDRFREKEVRDLRHRVVGKSGFIEGVSTLSGYLVARDQRTYVFSIMLNGIPRGSNSEIKQIQEKILHAVDVASQK